MFAYFAHPIDLAANATRMHGQIQQIRTIADLLGVTLFQPGRAYQLPDVEQQQPTALPSLNRTGQRQWAPDFHGVDTINQFALFHADALIALIPAGIPTLGVPAEIEQALMFNNPVVIFTDSSVAASSVQVRAWQQRGATVIVPGMDGDFSPAHCSSALALGLTTIPRAAPDNAPELPPPLLVSISNDGRQPARAYRGDAGLDLTITAGRTLASGESHMFPTGVSAAVPEGYWGFMTGRSSARVKLGLEVHTAVIDSGYRGELMVGVTNPHRNTAVKIEAGTRLAQYILLPAWMGDVVEVEELPEHERGLNGYGSSGA